ncbi:MAG TPA: 16S rRNA (guanine(527)-N(7))-methyltransferase RsmG [Solirubrobacteraceae bacterium]|nr:16S rRNA (guanine(527)-N(7))-methyltransferase RsmG [Solirubrobacteraceae bacterium]
MSAPHGRSPLDRYELSAQQHKQIDGLLDVLERDDRAPTAVRDRARALEVHIADSLVALDLDLLRDVRDVVDLGAGAGFPGLVLAVALPRARVHLIESQRRKCEFIERTTATAAIGNATVVCARAEEWADGFERNDVALARALAAQPVVLEYAAPLLRVGGALIDWRGRRDPEEERAAASAAAELGVELREIRHVVPFAGATDRHLHVWQKTAATPPRYPRRAGIARKRPLAAGTIAASDRDRR